MIFKFKTILSISQNFPIQCFSDAYSMMQHSPTNHPEASVCLFHDFGFFSIGAQCDSPTEEELKELELSLEVETEENSPFTLLPLRVPLVCTVTAGPLDTVPVKLVTNGDLASALVALDDEDEDELRAAWMAASMGPSS